MTRLEFSERMSEAYRLGFNDGRNAEKLAPVFDLASRRRPAPETKEAT